MGRKGASFQLSEGLNTAGHQEQNTHIHTETPQFYDSCIVIPKEDNKH